MINAEGLSTMLSPPTVPGPLRLVPICRHAWHQAARYGVMVACFIVGGVTMPVVGADGPRGTPTTVMVEITIADRTIAAPSHHLTAQPGAVTDIYFDPALQLLPSGPSATQIIAKAPGILSWIAPRVAGISSLTLTDPQSGAHIKLSLQVRGQVKGQEAIETQFSRR